MFVFSGDDGDGVNDVQAGAVSDVAGQVEGAKGLGVGGGLEEAVEAVELEEVAPFAVLGGAFANMGVGLEQNGSRRSPIFFGREIGRAGETCRNDDDVGSVLCGECFGGACRRARVYGRAHQDCRCAVGFEDTLGAGGRCENDAPAVGGGGVARAVSVVESFRRQTAAFAEEERIGAGDFRGERVFDSADCPDFGCAGGEKVGGGGAGAEGIDDDSNGAAVARVAAAGFAGDEVPGLGRHGEDGRAVPHFQTSLEGSIPRWMRWKNSRAPQAETRVGAIIGASMSTSAQEDGALSVNADYEWP